MNWKKEVEELREDFVEEVDYLRREFQRQTSRIGTLEKMTAALVARNAEQCWAPMSHDIDRMRAAMIAAGNQIEMLCRILLVLDSEAEARPTGRELARECYSILEPLRRSLMDGGRG